MPSVFIDGTEYVPKADIPELSDERLKRCLESLTEIQYFHECKHKHCAWAWDALNALAPDLARLASDNPQAAFDRIHGAEEDN